MEQLRNINMDGVKQKLSELEDGGVKKSDIEEVRQKILANTQLVMKMNKTVMDVEKLTETTRQHVDKRIEGNRDIIMKHTDQIEVLQKDAIDLKDVVMKSKRNLAMQSSLRSKIEAQAEANETTQKTEMDDE